MVEKKDGCPYKECRNPYLCRGVCMGVVRDLVHQNYQKRLTEERGGDMVVAPIHEGTDHDHTTGSAEPGQPRDGHDPDPARKAE